MKNTCQVWRGESLKKYLTNWPIFMPTSHRIRSSWSSHALFINLIFAWRKLSMVNKVDIETIEAFKNKIVKAKI